MIAGDEQRLRGVVGRLAQRAEGLAEQLGSIGRATNFVVLTRDETNELIDKLDALSDALRELQEIAGQPNEDE